jgi:GntR family transcriptional regulator
LLELEAVESGIAQKMSITRRASWPDKSSNSFVGEPRTPRYLQVASVLRHRIDDGTWSVGDQIPTIDAFEREFGVARVTVRQAIELLREEGLVQSQQGRGTFVVKTIERDRWLNLGTDWKSLLAPIEGNVPHALPSDDPPPPPKIHADDGEAAQAYVFLHSLQTREGAPYALARVHVAKHVFDIAPDAFRRRLALAVISSMKDLAVTRAWQTLEVGLADPQTARLLKVPLDSAVAKARVVVRGRRNVVLYVGEITYRGDCLRISIELTNVRR